MDIGTFLLDNPAVLIVLALIVILIGAMVPNNPNDSNNWRY